MVITGYALDIGKIIHIEGTDINCGIPVHIVQELSFGHADHGELLITDAVYKETFGDEYFEIFEFDWFSTTFQGVKLEYCRLNLNQEKYVEMREKNRDGDIDLFRNTI